MKMTLEIKNRSLQAVKISSLCQQFQADLEVGGYLQIASTYGLLSQMKLIIITDSGNK